MEQNEDRIPGSGASMFVAVMGAWLMLSPLLIRGAMGYAPPAEVYGNDIITGLLVLGTGVSGARIASPMPNWVQLALGVWLMVAPILLGYHFNAGINDMIVGVVVGLTGLFVAALKSQGGRRRAV